MIGEMQLLKVLENDSRMLLRMLKKKKLSKKNTLNIECLQKLKNNAWNIKTCKKMKK